MVLRNRRLSNLGASRFKNYYLKMKQIKLLTGKVRCNSFFFSKIRYIYIYISYKILLVDWTFSY
jgi:hypothetical protein